MKFIKDTFKKTGYKLFLVMLIASIGLYGCGDDDEAPAERNPEITDITPDTGPPGTAVTISGSDFSPTASQNSVTFAGTNAEVTDASESEINTTVPEGAESGAVEVTVDGNTASGPNFEVLSDAPGITEVEPDSGEVGTEVTITGTNFSSNTDEVTITFNDVDAPVNSATEEEIVTEVPEGASDGALVVTVNEQSATFEDFNVLDGDDSDDNDDEGDNGNGTEGNTIADYINNSDELTNLATYLEDTDLQTTLEGDDSHTVFALTDNALDNLSNNYSESEIVDIIRYNVIPEDRENVDFTPLETIQTLYNDELLYIAGNGSINNQNYTVQTTATDPSNGTVHIIDITDNIIENAFRPDAYSNVFEVAYKRPATNKFACNCISGDSGIGDDLQDESVNYTVFAPSTDAFNTYDGNNEVPVEERDDLEYFMNYHIIEGDIYTTGDLEDGQTLTTRNGEDITVSVSGDEVQLNFEGGGTATVETSDLEGNNGVVHIIDTIMEPPTND